MPTRGQKGGAVSAINTQRSQTEQGHQLDPTAQKVLEPLGANMASQASMFFPNFIPMPWLEIGPLPKPYRIGFLLTSRES